MRALLMTLGVALTAYGSASNPAHAPARGLTVEAKNVASPVEIGFNASYLLRHLL